MRIIFLDIDGVLINFESLKNNRAHPACMARLNRLCEESGAKVVVSSSWRLMEKPSCFGSLWLWGFTGEFMGKTPDLSHRSGSGISIGALRGDEISAWIMSHDNDIVVEGIAILDDDDVGDWGPWLVKTNPETGLTDADVDKALKMLAEGACIS